MASEAQSHRESPEERLTGSESTFDVAGEIAALRSEANWQRAHNAKTLIKRPDLRVVLLALNPGGRLDRHQAPGPITIHALEGRLRVDVEGSKHELRAGQLLFVDAARPHDVEALEASAFLLTVAWPKEE